MLPLQAAFELLGHSSPRTETECRHEVAPLRLLHLGGRSWSLGPIRATRVPPRLKRWQIAGLAEGDRVQGRVQLYPLWLLHILADPQQSPPHQDHAQKYLGPVPVHS